MVYPTNEETFDERVSPGFVRDDHLNLVQAFLKRLQDFLGYGGRLSDKFGIIVPPGVMFEWPDVAAPPGFLLCNGKAYNGNVSDYADLYAVIGKKYGGYGYKWFNVPDRRGYFTRGYSKIPSVSFGPEDVVTGPDSISLWGEEFHRSGFPVRFTTDDTLPAPLVINTTYYLLWDAPLSYQICLTRANVFSGNWIDLTTKGSGTSYCHPYVEEDKDTRLKLTAGGNDGEDLGSYQPDEFKSHTHKITTRSKSCQYGTDQYQVVNTWTQNSGAAGGVETRPRNVNVNYIIKR